MGVCTLTHFLLTVLFTSCLFLLTIWRSSAARITVLRCPAVLTQRFQDSAQVAPVRPSGQNVHDGIQNKVQCREGISHSEKGMTFEGKISLCDQDSYLKISLQEHFKFSNKRAVMCLISKKMYDFSLNTLYKGK